MQSQLLNNRYELLDVIGQGGMATVYRGRDTRLGRMVAVKLLLAQYRADAEFLGRFRHEAQAAAGLSAHPNIVDVYDVGEDNGVPYIVMELIEGRDLNEVIEAEGPLTPERTIRIAEQTADGLDFAHQRGFVHRDVKPHNLLVAADDSVKITDFGIAKSALSTAITQAGIAFGTADYISPEQAQGLGATPQSDIYSLGVVVYEMLAKRLPFTGETPMAVALQHVRQPPPPLRQWNPQVPPNLEGIVLGALAKDPAQRPQSARAFAEMLRQYRTARVQETVITPAVVAQPVWSPHSPAATQPLPVAEPQPPVQRVAPRRPVPVAPPPIRYSEPYERRGFPFGGLILGLLLLGGLLGLAYVAFATDIPQTLFGGSAPPPAPTTTAPTAEPTAAPTPLVQIQIPQYVGMSEVAARDALSQAGFALILLEPRQDPAPAGTVIEQDPAPGSVVPKGGSVTLRISLGPPPEPTPAVTPTPEPTATTAPSPTPVVIELPNLVGQNAEQVLVALTALGFRVNRIDEPSQTAPAGQIIAQSPQPGTFGPDTVITLTISQGDVVPFPAVIGQDRAQAEAILLESPDLVLQFVHEQGPDILPNFEQLRPNQVVSATANGAPVLNGQLIPRGSQIIIGVRRP